MFTINGRYTSARVMLESLDEETTRQIHAMVNHPAATNPVVIMPDTHAGKGCVIGFTMKLGDKVVPNWVGVDIGCGMLSVCLGKIESFSNEQLSKIDELIRKNVPMGMSVHPSYDKKIKTEFLEYLKLRAVYCGSVTGTAFGYATVESIEESVQSVGMSVDRFWASLGTLGGGNHFIEIGKDDEGDLWLTTHTGSRNFGKVVCEHFDRVAQAKLSVVDISAYTEEVKAMAARGEISKAEIGDLLGAKKREFKRDFDVKTSAYVEGKEMKDYMSMMYLAQTYAKFNRSEISRLVIDAIREVVGKAFVTNYIESIHNFISFRDNVVRKGAIESYEGQQMVIPFNMRDGLLLCWGRSNVDWNCSAPHGAGRVLSRRQAKDTIDIDDYKKSMEGIFTTSVCAATIDESPMAYKDASMIEEAIKPTAKLASRVKPIYNVKAGEE